jgi:hypothetical protein
VSNSTAVNATLLWRHKFSRKGRTFSSNFNFNKSLSDADGTLNSENNFFGNLNNEVQIIDQVNTQKTDNQTLGATFSYTEPLGNRRYLEFNYNYRINRNDVNREVFNRENSALEKDDLLSNEYTSDYTFSRPSINLRFNREKYNVTIGAGYQNTRLEGDLITRNILIDRTFRNVLPTARINYDFTSFKRIRLDYDASMREPTIQQLQPVIDNTDPLNIYIGNPNLKPAYAHTMSANFTTFDPAKSINFFTFINATYQTNAITTSQSVDQRLVRTSIPVNVKDNVNVSANMNLGFPVKKLKSRFNVGPTATYFESINVLNESESSVVQQTIGGNARYNFNMEDKFTLDLSANIRDQITSYESAPEQDQEFINTTWSAETSITILKNFQLNSSFDLYQYESKTTDFRQEIPILNIWLSRFLLKGNSGELKVGVSNLLDKSLGITQTASANFLQQETINNLGRYIMVSFTYALNRQLNPMGGGPGGRRGPGGMRMMIMRE